MDLFAQLENGALEFDDELVDSPTLQNGHSVSGARIISHLPTLRRRLETSADSDFGPSMSCSPRWLWYRERQLCAEIGSPRPRGASGTVRTVTVSEFLEIDGGKDVRTLVALVATVAILAGWSGAEASDGRETRTWANGDRYEGEWRNGNPHGRGTYTWANGERYEGEFREGKRIGQGTYTWATGDRYEGEFREGKRTGQATYTWTDGNRYEGEFHDGNQHGRGTLTFGDDWRYEGEWRYGKKHGRGTYTWADGDRYEGNWRYGKRHGRGTRTWVAGGFSTTCEWRDGESVSGTCEYQFH